MRFIIIACNFRFLIPAAATGTKLSKGQVFAKDDNGEHIAPQASYIEVPSRVVKATDMDAGFLGSLNLLKVNRQLISRPHSV